jgi:type I restriction enzyme S subunit
MLEKKLVPKLRFAEFDGVWEMKQIKNIAKVLGGGTPSTLTEDYWNGDINWFTPTEIKYNSVSKSKRKITSLGLCKSSATLLPKGTILLTTRATIGELAIAEEECTTNQGFQSLVVSKKNSNLFVFNLIKVHKHQLYKRANGSTFKEISKKEIEKIKVLVPQFSEQQKIASFLTEVDTKLSQLTKKKALLEDYKKGVMQQIFSQQLRFKDDNGNDYGDWEEKRLGEISICMDNKRIPLNGFERNSKKGDVPYWGANGIVDHVNEYIFDETIVLLAEDGGYFDEFQNRPIANISHGKSWVNNHAHVIKAKQSLTTNEYLYYSLVHKNIMGYVNGGTRAKLNKSEMLQIKMIIPSSIEEQTKIANFLSDLDAKIEVLSTSIENTQTFKKGLLQQLFV